MRTVPAQTRRPGGDTGKCFKRKRVSPRWEVGSRLREPERGARPGDRRATRLRPLPTGPRPNGRRVERVMGLGTPGAGRGLSFGLDPRKKLCALPVSPFPLPQPWQPLAHRFACSGRFPGTKPDAGRPPGSGLAHERASPRFARLAACVGASPPLEGGRCASCGVPRCVHPSPTTHTRGSHPRVAVGSHVGRFWGDTHSAIPCERDRGAVGSVRVMVLVPGLRAPASEPV